MTWSALLIAFMVCHLVGDYLLQTDWQARHKARGLGPDPLARRALLAHTAAYTAAFVPALAWLAGSAGAGAAALAGVLVAAPHLVVDDGRLVEWYVRRVKGVRGAAQGGLLTQVDQSLHVVSLWTVAVLATA